MIRNIEGTLYFPDGSAITKAVIKFVSNKMISGVPKGASSTFSTDPVTGFYAEEIIVGSYHIFLKLEGQALFRHIVDVTVFAVEDGAVNATLSLEDIVGDSLDIQPLYANCDLVSTPVDFEVISGFTSNILKWRAATYGCHAVTEIWTSEDNNIDNATLVATTEAAIYSHVLGHGEKVYYWIRFRDLNGVPGDFVSSPIFGQTAVNPADVLAEMQQSVYDSAIFTELRTAINSSFYQSDPPTAKVNGDFLISGDTWVDSDTGQSHVWDDSWIATISNDLETALAGLVEVADGEIKIFVLESSIEPGNPTYGDIWIKTDIVDNEDKVTNLSIYRYQGEVSHTGVMAWENAPENSLGLSYVKSFNTENSLLALNAEYSTFVGITLPADILAIQNQIDGNITTWFQDEAPALDNVPASTWTDAATKNNHLGDLYYDRVSGLAYRFSYEDIDDSPDAGVIYTWILLSDHGIAAALLNASTAQDTADGKRRVFVNDSTTTSATPVPPYDEGDLWSDGVNLKVSGVDKAEGSSYEAADWTPAANYITTYFAQASSPPSSPNTGDMWTVLDASDNVIDIQRYDGSAWVSLTVATLANVDTKIVEQVGYCERTVTATGDTNRTGAYTTKTLCEAAVVTGETFAWRDTGALASRTDIVSSTVGDHTSSISTQATSINGLESMYSVKLDNNGTVSGFGLSSGTSGCLVNGVLDDTIAESDCVDYTWNPTAVNADTSVGVCLVVGVEDLTINETACTELGGREWVTDSSTFLVAADKFAITGTDETPITPFLVSTVVEAICYVNGYPDPTINQTTCGTTTGGSWVAAGTGIVGIQGSLVLDGTMNANAIVAGSITGDHIAGTTITGAHIDGGTITASKLTVTGADKITAGTIGAVAPGDVFSSRLDVAFFVRLDGSTTGDEANSFPTGTNADDNYAVAEKGDLSFIGISTVRWSANTVEAAPSLLPEDYAINSNGESITVTDTSTTAAGVTTVTFSDGTYITVNDGYTPVKGTDYSDGVPGNNVRVEYSINGNDWVSTQITGTAYLYIRTAVDTNNDGNYVAGESTKFVPEFGIEYNNGNPGDPAYLHIKYSNDGTSFTGNSGETLGTYIGTLSDSTQADSSTFGDYTWQKYIGTDGSGSGVQVLYADKADPDSNSEIYLTQGTHTHTHYFEWSGTEPTAKPTYDSTRAFVRFIGTDGTAEGVVPIYSSVAAPTNVNQLSFDIGSNEHVTFFEWTGTSPSSIVADHLNETYIKFVGDNGSTTLTYDSSELGATIPTALVIGDILVDLGKGNKAYYATSVGANEIKSGEWEDITLEQQLVSLDAVLSYGVSNNNSSIYINNNSLVLSSVDDSSTGMAYPAIDVSDGEPVRFSVSARGDVENGSGWYVRVYEHNLELPVGKVAISGNASATYAPLCKDVPSSNPSAADGGYTTGSGLGALAPAWNNKPVSTDWVTKDFVYTPHANAVVASVEVLNYYGNGTNPLYVKTTLEGKHAISSFNASGHLYYPGTTEIDGGNIRTGTIDAVKLNANTISGNEVFIRNTVEGINGGLTQITGGVITANTLNIGNQNLEGRLIIDHATGSLSWGKTGSSDFTNKGLFIGNEGGHLKFNVGSSQSYMYYDGENDILFMTGETVTGPAVVGRANTWTTGTSIRYDIPPSVNGLKIQIAGGGGGGAGRSEVIYENCASNPSDVSDCFISGNDRVNGSAGGATKVTVRKVNGDIRAVFVANGGDGGSNGSGATGDSFSLGPFTGTGGASGIQNWSGTGTGVGAGGGGGGYSKNKTVEDNPWSYYYNEGGDEGLYFNKASYTGFSTGDYIIIDIGVGGAGGGVVSEATEGIWGGFTYYYTKPGGRGADGAVRIEITSTTS